MTDIATGFTHGFDIGYCGPDKRQSESQNIPLGDIGTDADLWDKIMKEVKAKRVAGPFNKIPFANYIQSPVGLVPKAGGKTRMIFHLSYNFNENEKSVNACTPKELCLVKYQDLDVTVQDCLRLFNEAVAELKHDGINLSEPGAQPTVFLGKTDLSAAFRMLPLLIKCIYWLVFKVKDLVDGKTKYFIEKCLPFGESISCSHYQ